MKQEREVGSNGPMGFWFLNGRLEPSVIDFQLDEFVSQAFAGVVLHPRNGLETPYLSETWFQIIEYILAGCKARNLEVWFYDENPYPSGSAGGRLLNEYPHLIAQTLNFHSVITEPQNGRVYLPFPAPGRLLRVFAFRLTADGRLGGPYMDITRYSGLVTDRWYVQGERTQGYGPVFVEDTGNPHWRAWNTHETWTLDWPVPEGGKFHILSIHITNEPSAQHGHYVDLLNPQTTRRFIELTHEATLNRLGPERFRQFAAGFLDEAHIPGPYPWTGQLPQEYQEAYRENLLDLLPHLAMDVDAHSPMIRYQYRQLLGRLWDKNFAQPLSQWYQDHGLCFTGHISPEEDPILATLNTPSLSRILQRFNWPGYDLILLPFGPAEAGKLLGPKLVSSIAHQEAKEHLMAEAFGCCGEGMTLRTMHRLINWLAIHGFDKYVLHGQFYSLEGHRKREAPPSIFYQAPYWPHFHQLSDYIDQISAWLGKGTPHRPLAVLFPTVPFEAWVPVQNEPAVQLAQHLAHLIQRLMSAGLDFDLVMDVDLAQARIQGTAFTVGTATYQALVIPNVPLLDAPAQQMLRHMQQAGVPIDSLSLEIQTLGQPGIQTRFADAQDNLDRLIARLVRRFRQWIGFPADRKLYVHSRQIGGCLERLVWNPEDQALACQYGQRSEVLEPGEARILTGDHSTRRHTPSARATAVPLTGPWTLTPQEPNTLLLSRWQLQLPEGAAHVVRLPARTGQLPWGLDHRVVSFWCEFIVEGDLETAELRFDRSTFAGPYELRINSQPLGPGQAIQTHEPHECRLDLGPGLVSGINRIEITVGPVIKNQPAMLEPLRLVGWFKVVRSDYQSIGSEAADVRPDWYKSLVGLQDASLARLVPVSRSLILTGPTDWTRVGFPHYSGIMTYSAHLRIEETTGPLILEIPNRQMDSCQVLINGVIAGLCGWPPFRLDIVHLLRTGENLLEIKVANTAINRTEGKAQPSGLLALPHILATPRLASADKANLSIISVPEH